MKGIHRKKWAKAIVILMVMVFAGQTVLSPISAQAEGTAEDAAAGADSAFGQGDASGIGDIQGDTDVGDSQNDADVRDDQNDTDVRNNQDAQEEDQEKTGGSDGSAENSADPAGSSQESEEEAPASDKADTEQDSSRKVSLLSGQAFTGTGTEAETPLEISNASQLKLLAEMYNSNTIYSELKVGADTHLFFKLTADISLSAYSTGEGWVPFGNSARPFIGNFDGGGHIISGLTAAGTQDEFGLFGVLEDGSAVENLRLSGCNINNNGKPDGYTGAIAGRSRGTIQNCSVSGTVKSSGITGGICGILEKGEVTSCLVLCTVESENQAAGGVAGEMADGSADSCAVLGQNINGAINDSITSSAGLSVTDCISWQYSCGTHSYAVPLSKAKLKKAGGWPQSLKKAPWSYAEGKIPSLGEEAADFPAFMQDFNGEGTQTDPYLISDWEEFKKFAASVSADNNYAGKYIKLANPITMPEEERTGEGFTPIEGFAGTFDGGHKDIRNVFINRPSKVGAGLFGKTDPDTPAVFQNIIMIGADITGNERVGAIVGEGYGAAVRYCYTDGSIKSTYKDAGGIMGSGYGCTIQECMSKARVEAQTGVGGILCYMEDGLVEDCYTDGELISLHAGSVGGVVAHPETDKSTIRRCYSLSVIAQIDEACLKGFRSGVGGVTGVVNGSCSDLLAINRSVGNVNGSYGYVTGKSLSGAQSEHLSYWAMIPGNTMRAYGENAGEGCSAKELQKKERWTAFRNQGGIWSYSEGGLPTLKNIPGRLQSGSWPEEIRDNYEELYEQKPEDITDIPYKTVNIHKASDLGWVTKHIKELDGWHIDFKADISLADYCAQGGWIPIGEEAGREVKLIVAGNNYKVSDMQIYSENLPDGEHYLGLFGRLARGSIVSGLHVENASIRVEPTKVTDDVLVGGLAAYGIGTDITYCSFDGTIDAASGKVGGIIGTAEAYLEANRIVDSGIIQGCAVRGEIIGSVSGGIACILQDTGVTQCYNLADITGGSGIVGRVDSEINRWGGKGDREFIMISDCYNRGEIKDGNGGIIGGVDSWNLWIGSEFLLNSYIKNSYNTGLVSNHFPNQNNNTSGIAGNYKVQISNEASSKTAKLVAKMSNVYSLGKEVLSDSDHSKVEVDPITGPPNVASNITGKIFSFDVDWNTCYMWDGQKVSKAGTTIDNSQFKCRKLNTAEIVNQINIYLPLGNPNWKVLDRSGALPILANAARPEWQTGELPEHLIKSMDTLPENSVIPLSTPEDLVWAQGKYKGQNNITFQLQNNIDMSGVDFQPFQNFTGTFDGNGYAIRNLHISGEDNVGLFSQLSGAASVKNLALIDCEMTGRSFVGQMAGTLRGGKIESCYAVRSMEAQQASPGAQQVSGRYAVGGIVGMMAAVRESSADSGVWSCYTALNVQAERYCGGLAGLISPPFDTNNKPNNIQDSFAAGNVQVSTSSAGSDAGGIVGCANRGYAYLKNNFAINNSVTSAGTQAGRIAGTWKSDSSTIFENQIAWSHMNCSTDAGSSLENGTEQLSAAELPERISTLLGQGQNWKDVKGSTPHLENMKNAQENYLPTQEEETGLIQDNGVYLIHDAKELLFMQNQVNSGAKVYREGKFLLKNDIDMSDILKYGKETWASIQAFQGDFDGGGHRIYGFKADFSKTARAALFDTIEKDAAVYDFTLEGNIQKIGGDMVSDYPKAALLCVTVKGSVHDVTVKGQVYAEALYLGGMAAELEGGTLENCRSEADVRIETDNVRSSAGGLCGYMNRGSISRSTNEGTLVRCAGTLIQDVGIAGGIVGQLDRGDVSLCSNTSTVQGYSSGGIVGAATYSESKSIKQCFSNGNIIGKCAGGIIGSTDHIDVLNCYTKGSVSAETDEGAAGGIAGSAQGYTTVKGCYSTADVSASKSAGGIVGFTMYTTIQSTAALNRSVSAPSGNANRIAGELDDKVNISQSYGYNEMFLSGDTKKGNAGTDIKKSTVWESGFWSEADKAGFDIVPDTAGNTSPWLWKKPSGDTRYLPQLSQIDGQDTEMPYYLIGFARGQITLELTAANKELAFSTDEQTVLINADLQYDPEEVSQTTLNWVHDQGTGNGVELKEVSAMTNMRELVIPAGFSGKITVTAQLLSNTSVKDGITITVAAPEIPKLESVEYGTLLGNITLPAGWIWKEPGIYAGNAGTNKHIGIIGGKEYSIDVTVTLRRLTIQADNKEKYMGEKDPQLTWSAVPPESLLAGDVIAGSLKYEGTDVGSYDIVEKEKLSNPNYNINFIPGTMVIHMPPKVQDVIDAIQALPDPVKDYEDADEAAAVTRAYRALTDTEQGQIPDPMKEKLETAQRQSGRINHADGTVSIDEIPALPWNVRLKAAAAGPDDGLFKSLSGQIGNRELLSLCRLSLYDTLEQRDYTIPQGNALTVRLGGQTLQDKLHVQAVYAETRSRSGYEVSYIDCEVQGNDTAVFSINSTGLYGLAAEKALPQITPAEYGTLLKDVPLPEGWKWKEPDIQAGAVGSQKHTAITGGTEYELALEVTPRPVTVKADDKEMTAGHDAPELTWTITDGSLINGDTITGSLKYNGSEAGTYDIVEDKKLENPNYSITFVKGTMKILLPQDTAAVIALIQGLPDPITNYADADQTAAASRAYNELSDNGRAQVPDNIRKKLKTAQQQSGKVNHTDGTAGIDDSPDLPWSVRLTAGMADPGDARFVNISGQIGKQELLRLYDLSLYDTLQQEMYSLPEGETLTVVLNGLQLKGKDGIQAVHAVPDNSTGYKVSYINCEVTGSDTAVFSADSTGLYGIAARKTEKGGNTAESPANDNNSKDNTSKGTPTGDTQPITLYLVLLAVSGLAALMASQKKLKNLIRQWLLKK